MVQNKKRLIVLLILSAVVLAVAGVLVCSYIRNRNAQSVPAAVQEIVYDDYTAPPGSAEKITSGKTWTVMLDAGHGYSDTGACSDLLGDVTEADINLSVAKKLQDKLKEQGITAVMTRDEGSGYNKEAEKFTPQDRVALANRSDIDLFLSIHCNSFPSNAAVTGTRIYYCLNDDNNNATKCFAARLDRRFAAGVSAVEPIMYPMKENDAFYVVRHADVPSVLLELGFITNENDASLLLDSSWQDKAAQAVADAIADYIADADIES